MKKLIRKILREQEEEIITAPSFSFFLNNWEDVLDWADDRLFRISGNIHLSESNITTLGGLVEVDGNLVLNSNLESIGNLEYVSGDLDLENCENIQSLNKLKKVGGFLDLRGCENLVSLGDLKSVGEFLFLSECVNLESLGNLEYVGGSSDLSYTFKLNSFGKLKFVGNNLYLRNSNINDIYEEWQIKQMIEIVGEIIYNQLP